PRVGGALRLHPPQALVALPRPRPARRGVPAVRDAAGPNRGRRPDHVLLPALPAGARAHEAAATYDVTVTLSPTSKLLFTLALFAVAVALVAVASAVREAAPLFFAWIPLLTVAWVLTRPESAAPEEQTSPEKESPAEAGAASTDPK